MRQEKMADDGELCPVLGLTKPDCDCNPATAFGHVSSCPNYDAFDEDEQCEHDGCEDAGGEWEIVEGQWCYDHVPRLDEVPQEWVIEPE